MQPGDIMVLAGVGPSGTGMEEIYQITAALKHLSYGKNIAIITDGRFSGVSTGACIGHVSPEALAGGPIGKLRDDDTLRITIDPRTGTSTIDLVGTTQRDLDPAAAAAELAARPPRSDLAPHDELPTDTKLWALLQSLSGGAWNGCVYDYDRIRDALHQRHDEHTPARHT